MNLDLLIPEIFPKSEIRAGVTTAKNDLTFSYKNSNQIIIQNKKSLAEYLNVSMNNLVFQKQIHSKIIQSINSGSSLATVSDAMITNKKGIYLNVLLADCLGLLIYDIKEKTIAVVHSGWRGTRKNIAKQTIQKMKRFYNSQTENLLIYMTPCAGGDRYEVEYDVAQYFPNHVKKISQSKYLFDNRKKVYDDLIHIGIPEQNIESSNICTISDKNFHSYRRDNKKAGRMTAFIGLI